MAYPKNILMLALTVAIGSPTHVHSQDGMPNPNDIPQQVSRHHIFEAIHYLNLSPQSFVEATAQWLGQNLVDEKTPTGRYNHGNSSIHTHVDNLHETSTDLDLRSPSGECLIDTMTFVTGLRNKSMWAIKMLDSFGRPEAGLLEGRVMWTGYYTECVSQRADTGQGAGFKGQYCSANLNIITPFIPPVPVTGWGICLPDSCDTNDAAFFINLAIQKLNLTKYNSSIHLTGGACHKPLPLPARAIGVISLVFLLIAIVVVATVVDILVVQLPLWRWEHLKEDADNVSMVEELGHVPQNTADNVQLVGSYDLTQRVNELHVLTRILLTFSAYTNSKKIWNTRQPKGTLQCINGIRVISISWVILGHSLVVFSAGVTDNTIQTGKVHLARWTFEVIYNGTFSVDSFFVLSGLLLTYLTMKEMSKHSGKINWGLFYLHRYIRLTPIYMVLLGIYAGAFPYLTDGPFWPQKGVAHNYCEKSWWANLLYIQNLIKWGDDATANGCFPWAWYLAVDMQLYVISPVILVPLFFKPLYGYITAGVLFVATTVTPFVLVMTRHYGVLGQLPDGYDHKEGDDNYDIYIAPYSRMGPYIIGMMAGYILYRRNCRIKMSWVSNLLGWALATGVGLACVYGLFHYADGSHKINLFVSALYNSLSRSAWGCCVAWVILSCVTGHGGLVNSFLSLPVWVPLSRLTYGAYLIHPMVMWLFSYSRQTPFYLDDRSLSLVFMSLLVSVHAFSFVASLVLEAPVVGLEKMAFNKDKRS